MLKYGTGETVWSCPNALTRRRIETPQNLLMPLDGTKKSMRSQCFRVNECAGKLATCYVLARAGGRDRLDQLDRPIAASF
jgi:ribosomal protein S3AE